MAHDKLGRKVISRTTTDGRKVVAAAGTAEALASSSTIVDYIIITAETNNTGVMAVGDSGVDETVATRTGIPLLAGESATLVGVDLADVYLDAGVSGDGVTYFYVT